MPNPNEMGYPGSQQQTAQVTDDQLASFVLNEIGSSAPRESIVVKLVNAYGKEPMEAVQFVDKMYKYIEQKQQEEIDSAQEEDADTEEITSGDDVANEMPVEEEVEEVRQTPTGTQMSNEIIDEWDSEGDDDDSEAAANLIMQYGGYYRAQDGVEVPIEIPDLSAYLPQNISDYYGNSDYISQMAYPELEEETEEYQGFEAPDMPEDVDFDVARYGGSKKSKKQFVKSVLSLVKKQMGGPNEDSETSSNDADPTGSSVRKQNLDKFINSVKNESAMATAQKQAEEHYDQMMQQQQMPPMNEEMQRGGRVVRGNKLRYKASQLRDFLTGRNRRNRREENDYNNSSTGYERGDYNQDGYTDASDYAFRGQFDEQRPGYRVDVRKSNWLTGRPSKYTIDYYGQSPMPGMGSQNQGNGMYTLDGKTYRWPATRKKVEVDAASVNKDAIKEVATATPDSNATTNAAETDVTSTTSSSTEGTVSKDVKAGDTKETVTTTKNGKTIVKAVDAKPVPGVTINSPIGNGNSSSELNKIIDAQSKIKKEVQRDSWGRPLGDKFYGYNPKTGKYEQGKVEKNWKTKSGNQATSFEGTYNTGWSPLTGNFGTNKKARYQIERDKNGKIIPSKSFAAVTQSEDYGGVIYVPWNELPNLSPDEGEDWNSGFGGDMLENKYGGSINYEIGGSVNDPFMDPYGNLQQFIDGGDEDFTQADIDDVYSKNTANADFPSEYQRGGGVRRLIENYFPGNIVGPRRTYRNEIQRVYDPRTGKTVVMPINMGNLSRVNVDKSRFWSGAPKKYTMYFNGSTGKPVTTSNNVSSQSGRDRFCSDYPNSPNCQGAKKPVRDNYPEDTRENNKNQRSGRQSYGFINDLKLRMQGLDEYGNPKGSKQSDKVPLSNEEMLIKQGKIWDEKSKRWIVKPEPLSAPMQYMKDSLTLPNNPQPFSFDQLINTSGPRNNEMQSNEMYDYKDVDVLNGDYNNDGYVDALDFVYSPEQVYLGTGNLNKSQDPELWAGKKVLDEVIVKPILKQYGGSLNKFLPKKVVGGPPPCGPGETLDPNTNKCVANPVFNDQTFAQPKAPIDPSIAASNSGTPVINAPVNNFNANQNSFNKPNEVNVDPSLDPNIMPKLPTVSTMDAFNNSFKKKPTGDEQIAIDVEKQNNKGKLTFGKNNTGVSEARIQTFNAGVDIADSIRRGIETNKAQNEMYENFSSNNLYASDPSRDRGDYDTNSGLYRPDEQGQMWNSRSKQFGGYIDEEEYYDPYLEEDEEDELTYAKGGEKITYMSEDQIRAFMAAGGQVEFL
jgi:hypothetical protein